MTDDDDTPLEEYLEHRKTSAARRNERDLQSWQEWEQSGRDPNKLTPLLQRFEPTFNHKVRSWKAPNVQEPAFRADLKTHAVQAFESFDPNRGASLRTHVNNRLKKSMRFNQRYQNMAYVPEAKTDLMGPIQRSRDALHTQLGRPPTPQEIAGHMKTQPGATKAMRQITPQMVNTVQQMQVKDVAGSAFQSDPVPQGMSTETHKADIVDLFRRDPKVLTPEERQVFTLMEDQQLTPGQVAKRLGKSPHAVSRIRTSINRKYQKYS